MGKDVEKEKVNINQFRKADTDTGSVPVQIALLTERIRGLTKHFHAHKKDFHSMRGLMKMVSRRKKLLSYIKIKDQENYQKVIKNLSLRK